MGIPLTSVCLTRLIKFKLIKFRCVDVEFFFIALTKAMKIGVVVERLAYLNKFNLMVCP